MATTFKTITKSALIEALEDIVDDDALIAFASDYGDHCHTQQLHRIKGNIEEVPVKESAYSDSGFAVADDDEWEPENETEKQTVFLLQ